MQDLRGAPPVSKATIVVVLVVFGLVLVVSAFGLWAFSSHLDGQRITLRESAVKNTRSQLERIQRSLEDRMRGLLDRVSRVDGPHKLANVNDSETHGPLVLQIFRFDERGAIRWVDRNYRLYAPENAIEEEARRQALDTQYEVNVRLTKEVRRERGAAAVLPEWQALADNWGLLATLPPGDSRLFPAGIHYAVSLLETAWELADADPERLAQPAMRAAIMRALEIEALWQDRKNIKSYSYWLTRLADEIQRLLDHLPDAMRTDLEWEVKRFRSYRDIARRTVDHANLQTAVHRLAQLGQFGRFVRDEDPELLGVIREPVGDAVVARLDKDAARKLVEDFVDAGSFAQLGMHVAVFDMAATPVFEGLKPAGVVDLDDTIYALPFRLAYFQIGDPEDTERGMTDLLFWVVIGLAAAGLVVGGYVLIRLLTREIRVAQLKADFVSNLSHELKTPITSISLFTEMLDDGKISEPEEQAEAFSVLADESQRLQRIVARMINVARGEARRNPFELEPGDLNKVVMEVATRFRRITTEPGLDLVVDLFPEPLPIRMDVQAVDDAVTNLLSNAWKYKRGDHVRITVRTARRGRHAELLVSDDGVGIPREDRRRVFEMFYRANQYLTHSVAGTGLGLALVRNVVRGHQGTVRIEAGDGGKGAAFRLRFPLDLMGVAAEEQAALGGAGPAGPATAAAPPSGRGIVDDDNPGAPAS